MSQTKIPYLDEVWNPITGCSGKGCKAQCWTRSMVRRFPAIHCEQVLRRDYDQDTPIAIERPFDEVVFHPDRLDQPLHWRKPRRVGVCFMGYLFDEQVPDEWISEVWHKMGEFYDKKGKRTNAYHMGHTYFVLTKQPHRMAEFCLSRYPKGYERQNVWNGVSITDQEDADSKIPELLKVPGKHWVSIEPMLGPVDFNALSDQEWNLNVLTGLRECPFGAQVTREHGPKLDWVVLGCESGPKRRPCPQDWMVDVVQQCKAAGVPVYVKQISLNGKVSHKPEDWPEELRVREFPA